MARLVVPGVLLAGLLSGGCAVFGGQAAPEPDYTVAVSEPPFEIREYPALAGATTTAAGDYDDAADAGFRRLFDYIRGANLPAEDIPMTAPVFVEPRGREIPMTAPVMVQAEDQAWQVMFILPPGVNAAQAPRPTDASIELGTLPARRVAVVRFTGFLNSGNIAEQRRRLAGWLEGRGERPTGPWQAAGYHPPWTLPWLRRNEVLVPVAGKP